MRRHTLGGRGGTALARGRGRRRGEGGEEEGGEDGVTPQEAQDERRRRREAQDGVPLRGRGRYAALEDGAQPEAGSPEDGEAGQAGQQQTKGGGRGVRVPAGRDRVRVRMETCGTAGTGGGTRGRCRR